MTSVCCICALHAKFSFLNARFLKLSESNKNIKIKDQFFDDRNKSLTWKMELEKPVQDKLKQQDYAHLLLFP